MRPAKAPGPTYSWPGKVAPCRSFNIGRKSLNWFLGGWDQELTSLHFAESSSSLMKHSSWPHRAVCGWGVCVNMCILSSESPRPLMLYFSILSAITVLKSHKGPVPNQLQTCRCWGSQGTVVSHWYEAVHHRYICRAMTSNNAISLYIFFFVTFFFTYVFCKIKVTRCQSLLWFYWCGYSSILKSYLKSLSNSFLKADFSDESPVHCILLLNAASFAILLTSQQ